MRQGREPNRSCADGTNNTHLPKSVCEQEDLVFELLKALPRASIANIQRRIAPLLKLDIVGLLPDEVALQVLSFLPWRVLLVCSTINRHWRNLSCDQSLWRSLCENQQWEWHNRPAAHTMASSQRDIYEDSDDEGMGDEEEDYLVEQMLIDDIGHGLSRLSGSELSRLAPLARTLSQQSSFRIRRRPARNSHSSLDSLLLQDTPSSDIQTTPKLDYRQLFRTHIRLYNRFNDADYRLKTLQTRGTFNAHTNTIYCLQLYTRPDTGVQVLYTGSKDHTIREWDLATGAVLRVMRGVHTGSVLSICAYDGMLVSGGSDRRVVIWDLATGTPTKTIRDHSDSVLCVRAGDKKLVTCSKDHTLRTYLLPDFTIQHILSDHRAAVNAVAISSGYIVSASGDRSMKIWNAENGALIKTFENHHARGIASIDFKYPYVLSGSSDKHLRLIDINSLQGWSTASELSDTPTLATTSQTVCEGCGNASLVMTGNNNTVVRQRTHEDLVRSVALGPEFVVSGSYDSSVKVWDRKTGHLVADLSGGHIGRIFCVGFDRTKIITCGEDQRICIWDFSHGIDTSFIKL